MIVSLLGESETLTNIIIFSLEQRIKKKKLIETSKKKKANKQTSKQTN